MKDEEKRFICLQVIRANSGISSLISSGYSYYDIFSEISYLVQHDYIIKNGEYSQYCLSTKGESLFDSLSRKLDKHGLYKFFSPQYFSILNSQECDVYLPSKDTLEEIENGVLEL